MLLLILREEIICTAILLFLIFHYCLNKVKDKEMLFLKAACLALLHVVLDMITVVTVNNRDLVPDGLNRVLHIGFYITGLLFASWFYNYVVQITASYKHTQILKKIGYSLLLFFTLLLFVLPMEYRSGQGTDYSHGPLVIAGYGIFFVYCTASLLILLISGKRLDNRIRMTLIPMFIFMYAAIIIQAAIPELLMTGGNATLVCIGLFATLDNPDKHYTEQALWDFSTGLKNRNSYNRDFERYTALRTRKHERIGFLIADINYLKAANDQYGHPEGDRLIAAAASVLRNHLKSAENIYRIGGDEFAAIYLSPDDHTVAAEIESVTRACDKALGYAVPLSMAIGYASGLIDDNNASAVFQQADENMYANKTELKHDLPYPNMSH